MNPLPRSRNSHVRPSLALAAAALLAASLAPPHASAQGLGLLAEAPARGAWTPAVEEARRIVVARMEEAGIPGMSAAVAVDGKVVWAEGFGYADVENRVPVDTDTKFRVASISKALTAAGVGRLVQEGRLDLDAPVQRYVPSFPRKRWPLTTRELAGHLAGVRHYRGDEFMNRKHYTDVVDALEIFRNDTLLFEPGTRFSYSTYGWTLVSAVVQGAAGERFLTYMRENVLDPLGLENTVAEHPDSIIAHRAHFYQRGQDHRLLNAPWVDDSNKWAGGGYLSTASDLVKYGSAYLRTGFFDQRTIDLLFTSQRTRDGYGIGWFTGTSGGRRTVWHTGGAMGGSTILLLYPDDGVVVALLANLQGARHTATARAIADLFAAVPR